nr:kinase [Paeniclostridium ghonii]
MVEEFDINGAIIRFSEEKIRYNTIRKEFLNQANEYKDKFKKELSKNYTSKDINETGLKLYKEYIDNCIKKGVEIVVNYEIITIDTNLFRKNYCLKYITYSKKSKNLSKDYLIQNKNKKISLAQKSMEDKKLINTLCDYLFEDCFKIHYAVIDALIDNEVNIVSSYIEEENIIKSNALFNNYKDGFIDKTNESYVIKQIIALNPYREDIYEFFIKEDGDFNKEIERLTKFLGHDVKKYKEYLMDKYVEDIEQNHSCDAEIEKEKLEKYAKYIGYDKKEIYCARVEALYIYKNA